MLVRRGLFLWLVLLLAAVLVACSPAGSGGTEPAADGQQSGHENEAADDHDDDAADHEHEEGEEEHDHEGESAGHGHGDRIPNDGATIRIVSPEDGAVFGAADEVLVEVEAEGFDLTEEGNHWHVYVDGASFGMIMGGDTDHALRNLEPGTHEISVYLSNEAHEEFEDGDTVTIVVE